MLWSTVASFKYGDVKKVLLACSLELATLPQKTMLALNRKRLLQKNRLKETGKNGDMNEEKKPQYRGPAGRSRQGNITRYMACGSIYHHATDCLQDKDNAGSRKRGRLTPQIRHR